MPRLKSKHGSCQKFYLRAAHPAFLRLSLQAFDAEFVKVDQSTLFDLILAANYLNIKSLLDLTCQTVAGMIKGKTPEVRSDPDWGLQGFLDHLQILSLCCLGPQMPAITWMLSVCCCSKQAFTALQSSCAMQACSRLGCFVRREEKAVCQLLMCSVLDMLSPLQEIRKTFNIKNDFTPEEEEEVRRENQWAFD
jgi:hypothetical protein